MINSTSGTVLITGGTTGLGYQTALHIAKHDPDIHIVLASRTNPEKADQLINKAIGRKNVEFVPLDLASLQRVRTFADKFISKDYPPITILLLNAGLQLNAGINYTEDGFEKTFAINHVGHALLLYLLRPCLADGCRIIITASGTHDPEQKTMVPDAVFTTAEALAHPTKEQVDKYDGRQVYATSKLCNVLWMYALQRRLAAGSPPSGGPKWTVAAFDPGLMPGTGLARDAPAIQRFIWLRVLPRLLPLLRRLLNPNVHTPQESGAALASLATGEIGGVAADGKYFEGTKEIRSSGPSYDETKQEDLWNWTIKAVAKDEMEKRDLERVYPSRS